MNMHCEEHVGLAPGDQLWNEWLDLLDRVEPAHRIFAPHWYAAWNATQGQREGWDGRLRVVAARDAGGTLQGLLPLGRQRMGPLSVSGSVGDWQPYRVVLAAQGVEAEVGAALAGHLRRRCPALLLGPYQTSSPAAAALLDTVRAGHGFVQLRMRLPLAITTPPATWQDYRLQVLGKEMFRKIEGYERRAAKTGTMTVEHIQQPSPDETATLLDELSLVESRSWLSGANGDMRFLPAAKRQMWKHYLDDWAVPRRLLDCWMVRAERRPVAFCFALTVPPARFAIACNFDEEFKAFRTGFILFRRMMEEGLSRGVTSVDLGHSGLHYKRFWGATYADTLDVSLVVPRPALGLIARAAAAAEAAVRRRRDAGAAEGEPEQAQVEAPASTSEAPLPAAQAAEARP